MKIFKTKSLFFLLLLVGEKSLAQSFSVSMPTLACLNQQVQMSADTTFIPTNYYCSWTITPLEDTLSLNPKNSEISVTYTSCGAHTISCQVYDNTNNAVPGSFFSQTVSVLCVNAPTTTITTPYTSVCSGFTSTLTAFGANSYTWLPGANVQQSLSVGPGTYTVIGTDTLGCQSQTTISIGLSPSLVISVSQSSQTTCITSNSPKFAKPVQLSAIGAGSYVWFPYNPNNTQNTPQITVRPASTTCYTVIGTSPVCSGSAVACVTVIPQFSITVAPPSPTICLSESVLLSITSVGVPAVGPSSAYTFSWTEALNAPPISMSGYFTPTVNVYPQNTTTYTTEVSDSRQCVSFPKLVNVTVEGDCTSLEEVKDSKDFIIFPNPTNDKLYLQATTDSPVSFKIINLVGEIVLEQKNILLDSVYEITTQDYKSGMYFLILQINQRKSYLKVLIKH
jgi:hypothetical protein